MSGTKNHKPNCQCPVCRAKRGEDHTKDCQCATCKMKRGEVTGEDHPCYKGIKKYCKDCGTSISKNATRCPSCHNENQKGKKAWNKGKTRSQKTKDKISATKEGTVSEKKGKSYEEIYGKEKAKEIKRKLSKSHIGNEPANKGKKLSEKEKEKMDMSGLKLGRGWNKGKEGVMPEPWNKGLTKEEDSRLICSKETKKKLSILVSGENHYCWKGGITPLANKIRRSFKYNNWQKSVFKRDNYICQECGVKSGNGERVILNAHHIKEFSIILEDFLNKYPELNAEDNKETLLELSENYKPFWNIDNGKTLCEECHKNTF